MSRIDLLRRSLMRLRGDQSVEMSPADIIAAVLDCSPDAAEEWLNRHGVPERSLAAARELAEQIGVNWQPAMDAAAAALQHRPGWTLDEAAPYALIWIIEQVIDRQARCAKPH